MSDLETKIVMADRTIVEHDRGAAIILTDKPGICFAIFDVTETPEGMFVEAKSGIWYNYHGSREKAERSARREYKRRCAAAKEFA